MWSPIETGKAGYFAGSALRSLVRRGFDCPSCGSTGSEVVSRKYLVTTLRRCRGCALLFRAPTSGDGALMKYYQKAYRSGFTTELPDPETLEGYLRGGFAATPKDFGRYIRCLQTLGVREGGCLLDLGCSWGYGTWQFARAGFDTVGLEVSTERAAFARDRLGVTTVSNVAGLDRELEVVFSSHVLEHIPALENLLRHVQTRLRPGGLFVAVTPNGSAEFRSRFPAQWDRLWGLKHPLFLDAEFWRKRLAGYQYLLTTNLEDLDALAEWSERPVATVGPMQGWELLVVYRMGIDT